MSSWTNFEYRISSIKLNSLIIRARVGSVWPFPFPVRFWSIFDQKPRSRFSSVRFPYASCDIYVKATTARRRRRVAGCAAGIQVSCCVVQNELPRNVIITQVAGPAVRTVLRYIILTPHPGSMSYLGRVLSVHDDVKRSCDQLRTIGERACCHH